MDHTNIVKITWKQAVSVPHFVLFYDNGTVTIVWDNGKPGDKNPITAIDSLIDRDFSFQGIENNVLIAGKYKHPSNEIWVYLPIAGG